MNQNPNGTAVAPKAALTVQIELSTNNSYGTSTLSLVHDALMYHRFTCQEEVFKNLREGEYETAYVWQQSVEDLSDVLDQMLEKTAKLAIGNYYAEEYSSNPGGYRTWLKHLPQDKASRYNTFLKSVLPIKTEEEAEKKDQESAGAAADADKKGEYYV